MRMKSSWREYSHGLLASSDRAIASALLRCLSWSAGLVAATARSSDFRASSTSACTGLRVAVAAGTGDAGGGGVVGRGAVTTSVGIGVTCGGWTVGRAVGGGGVLVGCGGMAVGRDTVGCGVAVSVPSARKVIPSQPMANPSTLITNARNTSKTWSPPRQGRTTRASMTNPPPKTMTPTTIASKLGIDISTYHNAGAARMFHLPQSYTHSCSSLLTPDPVLLQYLPRVRGRLCFASGEASHLR